MRKRLVLLTMLVLCACKKEKPLSFPMVQKYQGTAGDLFYFRPDGQFVLLERRKYFDIVVAPNGWEAHSQMGKITISRPVPNEPGQFWGSRTASQMMENTPFADAASRMEHLAFSPTGAFLAGGAPDGHLTVWEVSSGKGLELQEPAGVLSIAFPPEGSALAVGIGTHSVTGSGTVRLLELPTGLLKSSFGDQPATALVYVSNDVLAAGFADGALLISSPAEPALRKIPASAAAVTSLAAHPSGAVVASAHSDKQIHLWNLADSKNLGTLLSDVPPNPLFPRAIERIAFNADGSKLAAAYSDGEMRIWDMTALTAKHE